MYLHVEAGHKHTYMYIHNAVVLYLYNNTTGKPQERGIIQW